MDPRHRIQEHDDTDNYRQIESARFMRAVEKERGHHEDSAYPESQDIVTDPGKMNIPGSHDTGKYKKNCPLLPSHDKRLDYEYRRKERIRQDHHQV